MNLNLKLNAVITCGVTLMSKNSQKGQHKEGVFTTTYGTCMQNALYNSELTVYNYKQK